MSAAQSSIQNPFLPYQPLTEAQAWGCLGRDGDLKRYMRGLKRASSSLAVVVGSTGVGKSSFLRAKLAPQLRTDGYVVIYHQGSSADVLKTLALEIERGLGISGSQIGSLRRQSVDQIDESSDVRIQQQMAIADVNIQLQSSDAVNEFIRLVATLSSWADGNVGKSLVFIFDQLESFLQHAPPEKFSEAFISLAKCTDVGLPFHLILSVRDSFLHRLLGFLNQFPNLLRNLNTIGRIGRNDGKQAIEEYLRHGNVEFSAPLVDRIISDLDARGLLPLELQTVCFQVIESVLPRRTKAGVKDYDKLGGVQGIFKSYLTDRLAAFPAYQRRELISLLHVIAGVAPAAGSISIRDIQDHLPGLSDRYVNELLQSLIAIRIVHWETANSVVLSHDAMWNVIGEEYSRFVKWGDIENLLDEVVGDWVRFDVLPDKSRLEIVRPLITDLQPTHFQALVIVLGIYHYYDPDRNLELLEPVIKLARSLDPARFAEALNEQMVRHQRNVLSTSELFLLLCLDQVGVWDVILQVLRQNTQLGIALPIYRVLHHARIRRLHPLLLAAIADDQINDSVREDILRYCSDKQIPGLLEVARQSLASPNPIIRTVALRIASNLDVAPNTDRVIVQSLNDGDILVRLQAITLLGERRPSNAFDILTGLLMDENPRIRRRSLYALARLKHEAGYDLVSDLYQDTDPLVREAVYEILGETELKKFRPVFLTGIHDQVAFVRESACYALGRLGDKEVQADIAQLLSDPYLNVREAALISLGRLEATISKPNLYKSLDSRTISVRIDAIRKLTAIAGYDIDERLIELLDDPESEIRKESVRALGARRCNEALPRLVGLLHKELGQVLCEVIAAVQNIGSQEAVPHLVTLLQSHDEDVRERVVYALSELGGKNAIEGLRTALRDNSRSIRIRSIFGLGRLRATEVRANVDELDDPSDQELAYAKKYYLDQIEER